MERGVGRLLDGFWQLWVELDDITPLWDSDIEQIERWVSTSIAHTESVRTRAERLREQLLSAAAEHPRHAASLLSAADAAAFGAVVVDVYAEVTWAHPTEGLLPMLHWAANAYPLETPAHGEAYLAKLTAFPAVIDELRDRLTEAAPAGRGPLARHAAQSAAAIDTMLAAAIADDPLLQQLPPTALAEPAVTAWRDDVARSVRDDVRPALQRLRATLREVCVPAGRDDDRPGMVHRPDGAAEYAAILAAYTKPDLTPEAVHEIGLRQLEQLDEEYRQLGASVFGTEDTTEVRHRLGHDPALLHETPESVVAAAEALHARAEQRAPGWFSRLPAAPCEVRATTHGPIAFYARPSEDGSRPGVAWFNTGEPSAWGPNLASTVFHEGIPGHHFQLALAQEDRQLHPLHRHIALPAFAEGWGLYAERLADEMGLYESDLERLGMLGSDSMRACRLVVDTGIHALGWGRQRAIDFMLANSAMGEHEVTAEVDRYIGLPGQAASYMIGRLEIERLREESAQRLGERFDVRAFHDVVLGNGMVSLSALRSVVESWDPIG